MIFEIHLMHDKVIIVDVPKDEVKIGRSDDNDIVIPNSSISRYHCLIKKENNHYFITDLGSHNGTFINGVKIEAKKVVEFRKDSVISLSQTKLKISDPNTPAQRNSYTTTMTIAKMNQETIPKTGRLELDQESLRLKPEMKDKINAPKNPISEHFKSSYTKPNNAIFSYLFLILVLCLLGAIYYYLMH
jgi:pSer/pThr/pTyr-binding forkhead associated (FHA) protein